MTPADFSVGKIRIGEPAKDYVAPQDFHKLDRSKLVPFGWYRDGWFDGRRDEREVWTPIAKMGFETPTTPTPCTSSSCGGCCSRCIRYEQARRNWRDHHSVDYPGGAVPPW